MSARAALRAAGVLVLALGASAVLGACDLILRAASGDRHVDPHVDCSSGTCVCTGGFGDCDGNVDNGCETDLSQPNNCGGCGNVCVNGACNGTSCSCSAGFADCDGDPTNGCEAQIAVDPKNCGACQNNCAGGACISSVCQQATVATVPKAETIGLSGFLLYVGGCDSPPISEFTPNSTAGLPAVQANGCAHALSIVNSTLYWASDTLILANGLGGPTTPVQLATGVSPSKLLAGSPTFVYWWDAPPAPGTHALKRVPAAGGPVETIATGELTALAADGISAYWSDKDGVHAVAHTGASVTLLNGGVQAQAIAVDAMNLYAADASGIEVLPLGGGPATLLGAAKDPTALAVDDTSVYWADQGYGTVRKVPLAGGASTVLVTAQSFVAGAPILVGQTAVYWLSGQEVRTIAK